jgi:hypothetical protein
LKSKEKKYTFTDLVKKDHHGSSKKIKALSYEPAEHIKFSELVEPKKMTNTMGSKSQLADFNRRISLQ